MTELSLVVFDVDGTLVDSQRDIVASMTHAFGLLGLELPGRKAILETVGLSLPQTMQRLAPSLECSESEQLVEAYKKTYAELRIRAGSANSSPLYQGVAEVLRKLHSVDPLLLGVATGKSRRGLNALLDAHDLRRFFVTQQCADDHPSKPHPSMLEAALSETGVTADRAIMVGDTSFDLEMSRAAGFRFIGVSWGYHDRDRLAGADVIVDRVPELVDAILTEGTLA